MNNQLDTLSEYCDYLLTFQHGDNHSLLSIKTRIKLLDKISLTLHSQITTVEQKLHGQYLIKANYDIDSRVVLSYKQYTRDKSLNKLV